MQDPPGFIFVLRLPAVLERFGPDATFGRLQSQLQVYESQLATSQLEAIRKAEAVVRHATVFARYTKVLNAFAMQVSLAEAEAIRARVPEVAEVWPDVLVRASLNASVPHIRADVVWRLDANGDACASTGLPCLTGQGVIVGIIDTGVEYTHPDLGGCLGPSCKVIGGDDFVNRDSDPMDDHGHGTHVAAIAAGKGVLRGVAPDARIVAYKVLGRSGSGTSANVIAAIERSVDPNQDGNFADHLDVINLSLGAENGHPDDPLSRALDNAAAGGVVAVVAAGNDGPRGATVGSPGTSRRAITVGASGRSDDQVRSFSSRGPTPIGTVKPDVVAPGSSICAARANALSGAGCIDSRHTRLSGTSMAAPHVAGLAAILRQKARDWTPEQVKSTIRATASLIAGQGDPNTQGHGRVDAWQAAIQKHPAPVPVLQTHGDLKGVFDVRGLLSSNDFASFQLAIIAEASWSGGQWDLLAESSSLPSDDVILHDFDSTPHEGRHFFRLTEYAPSGQSAHDYAFLSIDNFSLTGLPRFVNGDVDLTGRAQVPGHDGYRLEYSLGDGPWQVLLEKEGPLPDGVIGTFPGATVPNGTYRLRLSIRVNGQWIVDEPLKVQVVHELRSGWPRTTLFNARDVLVYDSDGDGLNEIVTSEIRIVNDPDTAERPRLYFWEADGAVSFVNSIRSINDPQVDTVPAQGVMSVYPNPSSGGLETGSLVFGSGRNGLMSYTPQDPVAQFVPPWPKTFYNAGGNLLVRDAEVPIRIVDLDVDGRDEWVGVYQVGAQKYLYVLDDVGEIRSGFPVLIDDRLSSSYAPDHYFSVGDFDGDPPKEVAVVYTGSAGGVHSTMLRIYELDGSLRASRELLSSSNTLWVWGTVAADVDNNGRVELVVLLGDGAGVAVVQRLDADAELLSPPVTLFPANSATLAPADFKGDGVVRMVIDANDRNGMWTAILQPDGSVEEWASLDGSVSCGSSVGDVDADGVQEVVLWTRGSFADHYALRVFAADGSIKKLIRIEAEGLELFFCTGPPVITDLDRDSRTDVIAYGQVLDEATNDYKGILFPFNLGTVFNNGRMSWPRRDRDNQSSGILPPLDRTPRIAYWSGKVNQHVEDGIWKTDPDGRSGARIPKLPYCRRWYPDTIRVERYKFETIYDWKEAGNRGSHVRSVWTDRCVQPELSAKH